MLKRVISILAVAVLSVTVSANVQAATVTVQKGDTLWDLSRTNNTSLENIQKLNDLTTDLIHPGDVLTIAPEKHYSVKKGDSLWEIARDYQVTVLQLKEWNKLTTDLIHPGLNLLIYEGLNNNTTKVVTEKPIKQAAHEVSAKPAVQAPKESEPKEKKASTDNTSSKEITVKLQPIRLHVRDVLVLRLLALT